MKFLDSVRVAEWPRTGSCSRSRRAGTCTCSGFRAGAASRQSTRRIEWSLRSPSLPTSTRLATGGSDRIARVWGLLHGGVLKLEGHRKPITGVAFSPNGALVATSSKDGSAGSGTPRAGRCSTASKSPHDQEPLTSVAFSPDGSSVLTGSEDHDARLWSTKTGQTEQVLRRHSGTVRDAEFSPDGRWIVTVGPQTAQLWQRGIQDPLFRFGIGRAPVLTSAVLTRRAA